MIPVLPIQTDWSIVAGIALEAIRGADYNPAASFQALPMGGGPIFCVGHDLSEHALTSVRAWKGCCRSTPVVAFLAATPLVASVSWMTFSGRPFLRERPSCFFSPLAAAIDTLRTEREASYGASTASDLLTSSASVLSILLRPVPHVSTRHRFSQFLRGTGKQRRGRPSVCCNRRPDAEA